MILKTTYNNPVAAPGTNDKDALLTIYRGWSGNSLASLNDLYAFMTTPSAGRDSFLNSITPEIALERSKYYTQTYGG